MNLANEYGSTKEVSISSVKSRISLSMVERVLFLILA